MGSKLLGLVVLFIIYSANSQPIEEDEVYMNVIAQLDNLKLRMDMSDKLDLLSEKYADMDEIKEKSRKISKPVFDIRIDTMPEHCGQTDKLPSNCAEATDCTLRSGYYNISVSRYSTDTFLAFCDFNFQEGDWLYILRREDGSENFQRPWSDYVKGFGKVDNEYWIGLENLYALTNYDGPQELYVYIEDFNGASRYAKYDHFVIGNASEHYQLKVLGKYTGTAGDNLQYSVGAKFSTKDNVDNNYDLKNCVVGRKSGWWFKNPDCSDSTPTGFYYRGSYNAAKGFYDGAFWKGFNGKGYSHKNIALMIRRQRLSHN